MELTEDQFIEKYTKPCMHCTWLALLPSEYEWTTFACGYNVIKRESEFTKDSTKKWINWSMLNTKYYVFVWMYKKSMMVMIMMISLKY